MVKIHPPIQKIMHGNPILDIQSAAVTLKIRTRSQQSNQLIPSSHQCVYTSLFKIHQLVQKDNARKRSRHRRQRDQHKKQCPPPLGLGRNNCMSIIAMLHPFHCQRWRQKLCESKIHAFLLDKISQNGRITVNTYS